jgi:hypothetical protein
MHTVMAIIMTDKMISRFLKITGYLIPLMQSLPPLGVWIWFSYLAKIISMLKHMKTRVLEIEKVFICTTIPYSNAIKRSVKR